MKAVAGTCSTHFLFVCHGKDECHVVHLLHRVIVSIRMIDLHLKDVHAGTPDGVYVRFSSRSREEKQLHSEPDQDNRNNSDGIAAPVNP